MLHIYNIKVHNETPFIKIIDCSLTSLENYEMERWVRGFILKNVQWPNRLNTPELREKNSTSTDDRGHLQYHEKHTEPS